MRRRRDAVGAVAQIDFVEVQLEDFFLAQLTLDFQRQQDFVELAQIGFFTAEIKISRQLHGNGAAALAALARRHQHVGGAQNALIVHAGVLEKAVVLGGEKRLLHQWRNVIQRFRGASFLAKFTQ